MEKIKVGHIGIDTGLCWVGDPCYVLGNDSTYGPKNWNEFGHKHDKAVEKSEFGWDACEPLGNGIGFSISTGYGDGSYPVYIVRNKEGRVEKIIIEFLEEEE